MAITRRVFLRNTLSAAGLALLASSPGCVAGTLTPRVPPAEEDVLNFAPNAKRPALPSKAAAASFFLGGFECSTHLRSDGTRLNMAEATRHLEFIEQDYARLKSIGITACRDGASWVAIEPRPGLYDFRHCKTMLLAAENSGVEIVWDLLHFGWPNHVNIESPKFVESFASYAQAFARFLGEYKGRDAWVIIVPINEISFLSWAGAEESLVNPFKKRRGFEFKVQLARASIAGMMSIREVLPHALFLHCEPALHVAHAPFRIWEERRARRIDKLQFQAWDMLAGCLWPQLGGGAEYFNIVGVNYYRNNQRFYGERFIDGRDEAYVPFSKLLMRIWKRYGKPILISETGIEGTERPAWLRYMAAECGKALKTGCPIMGVAWYPIVNHPGWEDGRHCLNGLWDYADDKGDRPIYQPLEDEFLRFERPLAALRDEILDAAGLKERSDFRAWEGAECPKNVL